MGERGGGTGERGWGPEETDLNRRGGDERTYPCTRTRRRRTAGTFFVRLALGCESEHSVAIFGGARAFSLKKNAPADLALISPASANPGARSGFRRVTPPSVSFRGLRHLRAGEAGCREHPRALVLVLVRCARFPRRPRPRSRRGAPRRGGLLARASRGARRARSRPPPRRSRRRRRRPRRRRPGIPRRTTR